MIESCWFIDSLGFHVALMLMEIQEMNFLCSEVLDRGFDRVLVYLCSFITDQM